MRPSTTTKEKRQRRRARIRAKVSGTAERPRLAIFRSNNFTSAQLIDDVNKATLASATTQKITKGTPVEKALEAGKELAKVAKEKKISQVVFDRGGYIYTGRVRAFADGAREGGLEF